MSEIETTSPASTELGGQVAALRQQVFVQLLALIVISGTLAAYLYYQSRLLGKSIDNARPQVAEAMQVFNQNRPIVESFVNQLIAYGQTHPEFQQQILDKYHIKAAPKK